VQFLETERKHRGKGPNLREINKKKTNARGIEIRNQTKQRRKERKNRGTT
jgi:hypothetical protein